MDLLEFEELRRSETTDKLPFLGKEKTHTHTPRTGQSGSQEAEKEVNEMTRWMMDEKMHTVTQQA